MPAQLQLGDHVPDFVLPEASGVPVRLSEVYSRRNVVIAFYPSDFGMMCAVEMMKLCEMYPEFQSVQTEILGISTNSTHTHVGWKIRLEIPFPLLADFDAQITEKYGVLEGDIGYLEGRSKRAVFIIDRKGILNYVWVTDNPALEPDYEKIMDVCRSLK